MHNEEEVESIMVSLATARKMRAERRLLDQAQQREVKEIRNRGQSQALEIHLSAAWESLDGEADACCQLADTVHKSHKRVVLCGGYAGCLACGRFASTYGRSNRLRTACRNSCPTGSRGATRRMLAGKHPLGNKAKEWPSREHDPFPKRVVQ